MPQGQFRNRLSPKEMNRGVRMFESGISTSCCWDSECVTERGIPNLESSSNPWKSFHRHGRDRDRVQLNVRTGFCWFSVDDKGSWMLPAWITGVCISTHTVRNRLHEFGLSARRPAVRVPLTRQHVQDRLDFARTHVRWTVHEWTPVLFTDESRFCLDFTDKCHLVWRMSKEQFHYLNVAEHDRYGKGSVLVWAGISAKGNTDLYVVENGTLAAVRYCEEILDQLWDHMLVLSVRTLFWWMIMPVPNVHTSLMPIWNARQSCVWTNLLNHCCFIFIFLILFFVFSCFFFLFLFLFFFVFVFFFFRSAENNYYVSIL